MPNRRTVLLSGLAAALATALPAAPPASAAARPGPQGARVRPTLPAPSGRYPVGTFAARLAYTDAPDPWVPSRPYRELMVGLRYPARSVAGFPAAHQMTAGEAQGFAALNSFTGVPAARVDWAGTLTHAHTGAPARGDGGPWPVVLYSPGAGDPRSLGTTLCDDLASRGYVVVMIDHTYDASAVEFPGGRVERSVLPAEFLEAGADPVAMRALLKKTVDVRSADTRHVLDQLPDVLPPVLGGSVADLRRVGMFGHSAGGFTALQSMDRDRRIAAAANLDGVLAYVQDDSDPGYLSPVAEHGLDRPFLLLGKDGDVLGTEPAWASLWRRSTGWHRGLSLRGAEHASFTDAESMVPGIAAGLGLSRETVTGLIGTIAPRAAVFAQRAYVAAFFDRFLKGVDDRGLLDGPSPAHPQAVFFS